MRRGLDVLAAGLAAVLVLPLGLLVAGLVWLSLGRPVLFRQVRVGKAGKEFRITKFRTMRPEAWSGQPDAERDTRLGRLLRAASLDELPQLWNVLVGDMSLIGPRPTLPRQVQYYTPRQRGRLEIRPGLTGWAQVNGRNSITWPERIELDLEYIATRSLRLDMIIVWRTFRLLLHPVGIYGPGGVNHKFPVPDRSPQVSSEGTNGARP